MRQIRNVGESPFFVANIVFCRPAHVSDDSLLGGADSKECRLALDERGAICTSSMSRVKQLHGVVFPIANFADIVGSGPSA